MNLLRTHRPFAVVGFLISLFALGSVSDAQDNTDQSPTLLELHQQWRDLVPALNEAAAKVNESDPTGTSKTLQEEYDSLVEKSVKLVKKLETAAKAELEKDRTSIKAYQILMGISLDAASRNEDHRVLSIGDFLIRKGINPKFFEIAAKADQLSISQKEMFDELLTRQDEALVNDLPRVKFKTTKGDFVIELFENEAPGTVGNFVSLVKQGYYKDRLFHRVIEGFMAQTGGYRLEDGKEVGGEGPGYEIQSECTEPGRRPHFTGVISMANKGVPNSEGAEFFIVLQRKTTAHLDDKHTVFGRVIEGFEIFENIERTHMQSGFGKDIPIEGVLKDKIIATELLRARDHEYQPVKVKKAAPATTGNDLEPSDESGELNLNSPEDVDNEDDKS